MDRRSFLVSLGAAFLVACSGGGRADGLPLDGAQRAALSELGKAALQALPEGADAVKAALESHAGLAGLADDAAVRDALDAAITKDFADEVGISVGGWWLSRTEALLAALVTSG